MLIDVLSNGPGQLVVGDKDQSIYSFRYAHPDGIIEFSQVHVDTHDEVLGVCRRCPTRVVRMADSLILRNYPVGTSSRLVPMAGKPDGEVHIVQWPSLEDEARGLADFVGSVLARGDYGPADILILPPRRRIGYAIRDALVADGDFQEKVKINPQIVAHGQAKTKYGNGVASNFNVVQLSIVNGCSIPVVIPLGGITFKPEGTDKTECVEDGGADVVPYSLDHVTSIYSANRKLTGARAIYFNSIQALATLGSAVEPFFASGFTKGVSILGGGFTTASKEISIDMSAEQLQNITSQSFGSTEQVSAGGSLQKFAFIRRNQKCPNSVHEQNIRSGNFTVKVQMMAASAQNSGSASQAATPSAPAVQ